MFKQLMFTSLVLFTQVASADIPLPPAPSYPTVESARLNVGQVDQNILSPYLFESANVSVTYGYDSAGEPTPDTVVLVIFRKKDCPPGTACTRELPTPVRVELKVTSFSRNSCGINTITASHDARPVDGMLEEIKVHDYRSMICDLYVPYMTNVLYRTSFYNRMNGKEVTTESRLMGEAFRLLLPTHR